MLNPILHLLALLPLSWFHAAGILLGWTVYLASPRYAARLRENLARSGLGGDEGSGKKLLHQCIAESGKGVMELIPVWFGQPEKVVALVRACHGWEHAEAGLARGKGIIFLTPHLGCFEIAALYIAQHFPLTVLYRPPKLAWLEALMIAGRNQLTLAPANLHGVRALLRALKQRQAIGLLPDQAPGVGEGVWVDFFGRPAYTMTLPGRLAQTSGATVLMVFARRLPQGRGYALTFQPLAESLPTDASAAAQKLNLAVEALVCSCPQQYLWSYNRYKTPAGVARPC